MVEVTLLRTGTTRRGSFHFFQCSAVVTRTPLSFICITPSPTMATTTRSGWAIFAAKA
jgi:hypothetical protein